MSDTQTLEITKWIPAPANQVYKSFTSSVALESWFSDFAEAYAVENGRFFAWWDAGHAASGKFVKLEENKHLAFTWQGQGESAETKVDIYFDEKDGGTMLKIIHSGLGTEGHWVHSAKAMRGGWENALENLQTVYKTGLDKRIYDRPMLGIYLNQLVDEKIAQKLGIPVSTGVEISGVVEGLGAEAAGMQDKDVIFSLNGHELKVFSDVAAALAGKIAGDTVEVVFYRGTEKHTLEMKLSGRPISQIPETAKALAEVAQKSYQEVNTELDQIFSGVTDREAAAKPAPEEWSAKETLIHLLYSERWIHLATSCLVSDQRTGGFVNQPDLIAAMAKVYKLNELIEDLKRSEAITVALYAALPDEFVKDKRNFTHFAQSFAGNGSAEHMKSHFTQIKAAIEASHP